VRAVTDEAGQLLERHEYLPFGEEWNPQPAGDSRKFTGKERDAETGLDYFGARYYGSEIGRFTTVDPVYTWQENLVDPQRWNRYAYVRNNPLRFTDPDGRVIDTLLDVGFIAYDIFDIGRSVYKGEGVTGSQLAALGGDVVGALLPFATGIGAGIRAANKVENVIDVATAANKTENAASSSRRGVDFVVTEAEDAIPVPKGASGPVPVINKQGKTTGFAFEGGSGGHGLDPRVSNVRIMDPTPPGGKSPGYPGGYVTYENRVGQGVNPRTGRTVADSDPSRHIPLRAKEKQ